MKDILLCDKVTTVTICCILSCNSVYLDNKKLDVNTGTNDITGQLCLTQASNGCSVAIPSSCCSCWFTSDQFHQLSL